MPCRRGHGRVQPLRKMAWRPPKKPDTGSPRDPATPLLGAENRALNRGSHARIHSIIHDRQKVEAAPVSING